ncbi:SMP-30/gluconolactonase/LRE family protein [Massilia antarctica]|uniref:SMP-30/gluconolactonase/LRE family protein n=1 Tax=Massilia antarctica TaxID=2765360 RepID=UPI0006BB83CC|nr:SMP-30/gluconolactonase/LRE family protein [Massilia sp. H27-R4]MCY0914321.1 SMP-30/gluconolactonase/LRE family protein [Massilia sp. H27-R4]CUI08736.1 Gluconolactonase [Janthinobacterium sp. CG23_2]CUU32522.1 Gluconolactonase [Janthinobacterium sp. CG23_2]
MLPTLTLHSPARLVLRLVLRLALAVPLGWSVAPGAAAAQCAGVAPAGSLSAARVAGTAPTHAEAGLYEGPVWIGDSLYFSDFTFGPGFPSRIQRLGPDGKVSTAIADSGSNGLAVDARGNIVVGTHKYKGVSRFALPGGKRTLVAGIYNGKVFNSPNDLAIAADGTMYFTDPAFQRDAAPGGQDGTYVYRVAPGGKVTVVERAIANPNGVALSPTGDILYVNGGGEHGVLRAYPIVRGVPGKGRDLVTGLAVPDGMTVDCQGNIYVTEHTAQRLRVFSPAGKALAVVRVDANITNAAFGGADGKTLYMTGAGAVWQIRLGLAGQPY